MKAIYKNALEKGTLLKFQSFETPKGLYMLLLCRYEGEIFMFKYKDAKLVECVNLGRARWY